MKTNERKYLLDTCACLSRGANSLLMSTRYLVLKTYILNHSGIYSLPRVLTGFQGDLVAKALSLFDFRTQFAYVHRPWPVAMRD